MYLMKNDIREKKRVPLADLLWAVAVVLLVLWALGLATSCTCCHNNVTAILSLF